MHVEVGVCNNLSGCFAQKAYQAGCGRERRGAIRSEPRSRSGGGIGNSAETMRAASGVQRVKTNRTPQQIQWRRFLWTKYLLAAPAPDLNSVLRFPETDMFECGDARPVCGQRCRSLGWRERRLSWGDKEGFPGFSRRAAQACTKECA